MVLNPVQYVPSGGDFPRFAGLDPTGTIFLACNKKTHNVNVFRVDQATGKLTLTGTTQIAWCTCIAY